VFVFVSCVPHMLMVERVLTPFNVRHSQFYEARVHSGNSRTSSSQAHTLSGLWSLECGVSGDRLESLLAPVVQAATARTAGSRITWRGDGGVHFSRTQTTGHTPYNA